MRESVLDFFIIIGYTDTVYIFCSLGTTDLLNRNGLEPPEKRRMERNGGIFSVYVICAEFRKIDAILYIIFLKGMFEYHDKG